MIKPHLSAKEQVELLQSRGMLIDHPEAAEEFLLSNNYYRINIYFHKFMNEPNQFRPGLSFIDLLEVYLFDRWLRNQLFLLIEPIEIRLRTQIAYELSERYGSKCFYDKENFQDQEIYTGLYKKFIDDENRGRINGDPVILHHINHYANIFPIWVIVEYLSFSSSSKLYSCLKLRDQKLIAQNGFRINEYFLKGWLHSLSDLRNVCAHFGFLYQRNFSHRPKLIREFNWPVDQNDKLFALTLVLKFLSNQQDWQSFYTGLVEKNKTLRKLSLADYGFPSNWSDFLL